VEAFFERAAPDYEAARTRLDELRAEHGRVMALLAEAQEHERKVARVLSAAELASGKILDRARESAAERIAAAERAVADLLRSAEAEREGILAGIERIRYRQARVVRVLEAEIAGLLIPDALPVTQAVSDDVTVEGVQEITPITAAQPQSAVLVEPAAVPAASPVTSIVANPVDATNPPDAPEISTHVVDPVAAMSESHEAGEHPTRVAAFGLPVDDGESATDLWVPSPADAERDAASPADSTAPGTPAVVSHAPRRGLLVAAGVAAVVIISVAAIPWVSGSAGASARQGAPVTSPAPAVRTTTPAAHAAGPEAPAAPAPVPAPSPDTLRVQLKATSDCWVRLTAGSYSEERLLGAGETLEYESKNDVVVRTGNAGALIVTVNGRTMAPLGGEGEVITRRITRPIPVS
jgi:hypothetical protein